MVSQLELAKGQMPCRKKMIYGFYAVSLNHIQDFAGEEMEMWAGEGREDIMDHFHVSLLIVFNDTIKLHPCPPWTPSLGQMIQSPSAQA